MSVDAPFHDHCDTLGMVRKHGTRKFAGGTLFFAPGLTGDIVAIKWIFGGIERGTRILLKDFITLSKEQLLLLDKIFSDTSKASNESFRIIKTLEQEIGFLIKSCESVQQLCVDTLMLALTNANKKKD